MVESGHVTGIRQMTYHPVDGTATAVEVMTFDRLRTLNDGGTQRADFHVLAVVDAGHGSVSIDFASYPLTERSAVWIAPGAVHRWEEMADMAGHLVLFIPTAPVTHATRELLAAPDLVAGWRIPDEEWRFVAAAMEHLRLEASVALTGPATELPEILVSALIARLRPPHVGARSREHDVPLVPLERRGPLPSPSRCRLLRTGPGLCTAHAVESGSAGHRPDSEDLHHRPRRSGSQAAARARPVHRRQMRLRTRLPRRVQLLGVLPQGDRAPPRRMAAQHSATG